LVKTKTRSYEKNPSIFIQHFCVGIISAQTYSQKFQEVFQHVNLNQLSTGILYDRVLPFSNITRYTLPFLSQSDTCDYYQFVLAYDELYHAGANVVFLLDSVE